MAFNGSGDFTVDAAGTPVQYDTVVDFNMFNSLLAELEQALSTTLCRDGQSTVTGHISLSGFRLQDVGQGLDRGAAVNIDGVVRSTYTYAGAAGGTANAITVSLLATVTGYTAGMRVTFLPTATNSGAATVNVSSLGVKNIVRPGGAALVAGDIVSGVIADIVYDGTNFVLISPIYAEGTWTPSVGGSATYTTQIGRYTKIGRVVHVVGHLVINAIGTGSTNTISGLPFTSANIAVDQALHVGDFSSLATSVVWIGARVNANSTSVALRNLTAAGTTAASSALLGNGALVSFGGSYTV